MTREQWIEEHIWLVHKIVRNMDHQRKDTEDMVSEGMIGLIKAVNAYDVARSVKFTTYAAKCIENELYDYFRKAPKKEQLVSLEEESCIESEEATMRLKRSEEYIYLYEALKALQKKDRILLDLQYGLTGEICSQQQIAEMLGVSQSTVSREEKRILNILRKSMK